jgi:organic radical activating enzyme
MKIIKIEQTTPAFFLTWVINNICTNQCSYCPTNLHAGTNHNYDWSETKRLAEYLIKTHPRMSLAISGGEPTLSPWLKDLVKMFSDAGHPVGMTTNGARTVRYFEDIAQYMSYIVMSYHPSFEDLKLIEKAEACARHTHTTVSIMMDSRYFDKSLAMYERIKKNHPSLSVEPIRVHDWGVGSTDGRDYTPEQEQILNRLTRINATQVVHPKNPGVSGATAYYDNGIQEKLHAQKLINDRQTNFQGWECDIGLNSLYIRYDGVIRLGNCIGSAIIGKLQDFDNIEWPTKTFTCPQTFCNCTTDVYISKRKV